MADHPVTYKPHRWNYDQINGFWAHCNCGFSSSSISDYLLRRRMDKHVHDATRQDYLVAQIEQIKPPRVAD